MTPTLRRLPAGVALALSLALATPPSLGAPPTPAPSDEVEAPPRHSAETDTVLDDPGVQKAPTTPTEEQEREAREALWAVERPPRVRWKSHWQEFEWPHWLGTGLALGLTATNRFILPGPPPSRTWRGGILFDDAFNDAFSIYAEDDPTERAVIAMTDLTLYGAILYRVVDSLAAPGLGHGDWKLASQMLLIDIESSAVFLAIFTTTQMLVGRLRPRYEEDCVVIDTDDGAACEGLSEGSAFQGFFAGHPGMVVTLAALTCLHHDRIPLYGGWGDDFACGAMIVAATANGIGRVITEKHYASDLLVGVAAGLFSGWIVPSLLHYGFSEPDDAGPVELDDATRRPEDPGEVRLSVMPAASDQGAGMFVVGAW